MPGRTLLPQADKRHAVDCSNRETDFFYDGLEDGKLLIQRCDSCGRLRNPPSTGCFWCHSLDWTAQEMAGTGALYTYTVHHHPPIPGLEQPHAVGVIDLDEGVRFVGELAVPHDEIAIGMPLHAEFYRREAVATVRFRKA